MMKFIYSLILVGLFLFIRCNRESEVGSPPSEVSDLVVKAGFNEVTLSWKSPSESDVKEYWVKVNPLTINAFSIDKSKNTCIVPNLKGLTKYTFTLLVKNESGLVSKGVSVSGTPLEKDIKAPSNPTNFFSNTGSNFITLSWVKPTEEDLAGYKLTYMPGSGSVDIQKAVQSYKVEGLITDTEYTFTLKSYDESKNESSGIILKATPKDGDNTPPGAVSDVSFLGNYASKEFTVSWVNPSDSDLAGVQLSYSYEGEELNVVDLLKDKGRYTIKGTYEKNYTLILKTKDNSGNYSREVTKKVRFGNFSPSGQAIDFTEILAGKLKISGTNLTDLSQFSKLERIEGKFDIAGNPELTSLSAFSNLKFVGSRVLITNNPKLSDFCGLKTLVNQGAPASFTITGNLSNPTKDQIKACK